MSGRVVCSLCLIKLYSQHTAKLTSFIMTEQGEREGSMIGCLRMISGFLLKALSLLHLCKTITCEAECFNGCVRILIGCTSF